jgi:hypothetical protein
LSYTLTVRHGSRVERERFDELEPAVAALERRATEIRAAGPLETVKAIREYEPSARINARLELSTGGWMRSRGAGLDVMGDGELVPYSGAIRRRRLEPRDGATAFDAVREAMC